MATTVKSAMPTKATSVTLAPPTLSDSQPPTGRATEPISAHEAEPGEVGGDERVAGQELGERVLDDQGSANEKPMNDPKVPM